MQFPRPEFCISKRRPSAPHPGPGTEAHALLLPGDGHMDDLRISAYQVQQLLQIDAGDGCGEVYPGALEAAIDGEAGGHRLAVALDGKKPSANRLMLWGQRIVAENRAETAFALSLGLLQVGLLVHICPLSGPSQIR